MCTARRFGRCGGRDCCSGSTKTSERNEQLGKFASGENKVLYACDLLNEGWDCPQTGVLFMARPTMSKVLYTQQLGRGMRTSEGKDHLMVIDFADNASQYNEARRDACLKVEKANSIFAKGGYTDKEAERNILSNPFKRFEDINMMRHAKTLGIVEVDGAVWKKLTPEEKEMIE